MTTLKTGHFYDHDDHGIVLLTNITTSYGQYDTDALAENYGTTTVTYYTGWDDYGPATFDPTARRSTSPEGFAEHTTHLMEGEFLGPDSDTVSTPDHD